MDKISKATLDETRNILGGNEGVYKSFDGPKGHLTGINLEKPAKSIIPFHSPLVNRISRRNLTETGEMASDQIIYKVIKDLHVAKPATARRGERGAMVGYDNETVTVPLKKIGVQDAISYEEEADNRGFTDVLALSATNLILQHKVEEEMILLGGTPESIGEVGKPDVKVEEGGKIPKGEYTVSVVALTIPGIANLTKEIQINNLKLYPDRGCTLPSEVSGVEVISDSGSKLELYVKPVERAFGYAWFVGKGKTKGNETLQVITGYPLYTIDRIVEGGTPLSAIVDDTSGDANAYGGISDYIFKSGNFYDQDMKPFNRESGGVAEIDAKLAMLWNNYRLAPTRFLCSQAVSRSITQAIVEGSGGPVMVVQSGDQKTALNASYLVTTYRNQSVGGQPIPIEVHPYLPDGHMMILTESLPYPNSNISDVFQVGYNYDYRMTPYARVKDLYEYGIASYGALKCYMPSVQILIKNIAKGIHNVK